MTARLTTPTWVTFNGGQSYYYVSGIEDGYYDDNELDWVAAEITLTEELGAGTITLAVDCAEWANAEISNARKYVDLRRD